MWGSTCGFSLGTHSAKLPSTILRLCSSVSPTYLSFGPHYRSGWRNLTTRRIYRRYTKQRLFCMPGRERRQVWRTQWGATWRACSCRAWNPPCSISATLSSCLDLRRMWSEYGSPNFARRAKDQAVVLHKESVLRLLGLLSQRDQYPFLWLQSPILVPQAVGALTSPCCPPRSLSLRVSPFPQCLSSLWALPYIQIEVHALPRSLGGQRKGIAGEKTLGFLPGFWD